MPCPRPGGGRSTAAGPENIEKVAQPTSPSNSGGFGGRSSDSRRGIDAADQEGGALAPTRGERIENSPTRSCGVPNGHGAAD